MATIRLTIDGATVEVEKGRTVLEAAQAAGIRIPSLCHDPRLTPFGACRLCVVLQRGKTELLPACFTPAREGMDLLTQSPEIIASRRLQLQLILLNHPMICPRCEKEGECELQNLLYEYGVEETRYPWERAPFPADDHSPLIQRDPNKCILCGRCVRICDEVQGAGELSFTGRGMKTAIDTDFHRPLECEFCGQCLDTCPVGAITSDRFDYGMKGWELSETTTPCPYCACGCLLTAASKDGRIKRVFSSRGVGPNDANLCVKGRFGWDVADHPERIKTPLLKVNGTFNEVSWEEALQFVSRSLKEIKERDGAQAVAGLASGRLTNEELYLFRRLLRETLGTRQIDHEDGRYYEGLTEGLRETLGLAASTSSIREIRKADCLLVVGVDPAQTHPILRNEIHQALRRNGAQLIVVGSNEIGLFRATRLSPLLPPGILLLEKPGRETALIHGMTETILREGLEDRTFIEVKTEGIEALRDSLGPLREELRRLFSEETRRKIESAAKAFAGAKRAMILIGSGQGSHLPPKEIATASSNLALITGHVGRESCGILCLLEKCNSQGALDMGVLPDEKGDLFQKAEDGQLKALYLVGATPSLFSSPRQKEALKKLDLVIVQDPFVNDLTAAAHVVLPAAAFVEKAGTFTSLERRVQRLHPVRPPLHHSKSDFDIFRELINRLDGASPALGPEEVFEEITKRVSSYKEIRDGEQWPRGSTFLYGEGFPGGRAKIVAVHGEMDRPAQEGYPFLLVHRPSLFRSGLLSSRSEALEKVAEKPSLHINPEDAKALNLREGEVAQVSAADGQSLNLPVRHAATLVAGVATAPEPCPLLARRGVASIQIQTPKKEGK